MKNHLFIYKYSHKIFGGFSDLINKFSEGIIDHGDKVYIMTDDPFYKNLGTIKHGKVDIYYFSLKNILKFLFFKKIHGIIFCEPFKNYLLAAFLFKILRPSIILSIYCCGSKTEERTGFEEFLVKLGRKFFINNFISCTYYAGRKILGEQYEKLSKIIYCPVDVKIYKRNEGINKKIVLSIDRLRERKNQLALIEAFNIVHNVDPEITLEIIGDYKKLNDRNKLKDYAQKVIDKIEEYGLQDVVTLHGEVDDKEKIDWLNKATVFIKTSHNEMQGVIATEAVASGLPVIAFDNSGTHEVVKDAGGILVPHGDIKKLAEEIIRVVNDKKLLKSISHQSVKSAFKYSFENNIDKFYTIVTKK